MVAYTWEFGIDWNAVETADTIPESYLRGCLKLGSVLQPGTNVALHGDTITFKIFDVTPGTTAGVDSISSLEILSTAAVKSQAEAQIHYGLGLETSQPAISLVITEFSDKTPETSSAFGPARASWTAQAPVYVTAAQGQRFLLTPRVLATGGNVTRLFSHDPEMVVGPNT